MTTRCFSTERLPKFHVAAGASRPPYGIDFFPFIVPAKFQFAALLTKADKHIRYFRRERPVCRSECSVTRDVPAERHIGRSLRALNNNLPRQYRSRGPGVVGLLPRVRNELAAGPPRQIPIWQERRRIQKIPPSFVWNGGGKIILWCWAAGNPGYPGGLFWWAGRGASPGPCR